MSTEVVLNHHLESFGAGDLGGFMEDYTEDSVFITRDGTLPGLDSIRGAFIPFFEGLFKPGTFGFTMGRISRWIV